MAAACLVATSVVLVADHGFSARVADPQHGGYYQRLADGFLHGELGIRERPPKWLIEAKDPYNPRVNAPFQKYGIGDALLVNGRIYYYWGPAPVVLAVIPARALGIELDETRLGVLALVVAVFVTAFLVKRVSDRWRLPSFVEFMLTLGLASFFSAAHLLRRVAIWEGAVLIAGALGLIALLCFVTAVLSEASRLQRQRRSGRAWVLGGVFLALAIGTRISYAAYALVPIVLMTVKFAQQRRSGGHGTYRDLFRRLFLVLLPSAVMMVLLAIYNAARFGSPTDIGVTKTLGGGVDQSKVAVSSIAYILPNSYYYLVRPLSWAPFFPFLRFDRFAWPFATGGDYNQFEPVVGISNSAPLLVLGVVLLVIAAFRPVLRRDVRFYIAACLLPCALVQTVLISYSTYGATQRYRYEVDLLLTVVAVFTISLTWSALRTREMRCAFGALVSVAAAFTFIVAILLNPFHGVYPYDQLSNPLRSALEKVARPVEERTLDKKPYVVLEPGTPGAFKPLGGRTRLGPDSVFHVYSGGDCPVVIELVRPKEDTSALDVGESEGALVSEGARGLALDVPQSWGETIVHLAIDRSDRSRWTPLTRATARYSCP